MRPAALAGARAILACALVNGAVASMAHAQDDWITVPAESAHVRDVRLTSLSLLWIETRDLPAGTSVAASVTGEPASTAVPPAGVLLPSGAYSLRISVVGELPPVSVRVRVHAVPVRTVAARDSVVAVDLDEAVAWVRPRRFRVNVRQAGSVALVASGFTPTVAWRFPNGEERATGDVVQTAGPAELLVDVDGGIAPGLPAAIAFRAFPAVDDHEPNDEPSLASDVTPNEWLTHSFGRRGDVDHLSVAVESPGTLSVEWGIVPTGLAPVGELLDKDDAPVASLVVDSGTVIARLRERDGAWSPEPLTVRVRFTPLAAVASGTPRGGLPVMTFGTPLRLRLVPPAYADSFAFEVRRRGRIEIFPETGDPTLHPVLTLRRADGRLSGVRHDFATVVYPALYVAVVSYPTKPAAGGTTVVMRAAFIPDGDRHEPNDHDSTATSVSLPASIEGQIEGSNDLDLFAFDVEEAGVVRVRRGVMSPFDTTRMRFSLRAVGDSVYIVPRTSFDQGFEVQFPVDTGPHVLTVWSSSAETPAYTYELSFASTTSLQSSGDLAVALIGIALDSQTTRFLGRTALASGALYFEAADTGAVSAALDSASVQLSRSLFASSRPIVPLLIALALVAAAGIVWTRRARRRGRSGAEAPSPPESSALG